MKISFSARMLSLISLSALLALAPGAALAASITINNYSFENPGNPIDNGWGYNIPNWTVTPDQGAGTWNPPTSSYYNQAPDGLNVAWINAKDGTVYQQTAAALTSGYQYTLKVYVGARRDLAFPGYKVQLLAGNNLLVEDNNSLTPSTGYFVQTTLNYTAGSQYLGQNLGVKLIRGGTQTSGVQTNFDMVTLDYVAPVPLPGSLLLLGTGILGLALLGFRRRSGVQR